jgi:hypothetical protein
MLIIQEEGAKILVDIDRNIYLPVTTKTVKVRPLKFNRIDSIISS